eukprot:1004329-Pyramimonas_sp.AAC.1
MRRRMTRGARLPERARDARLPMRTRRGTDSRARREKAERGYARRRPDAPCQESEGGDEAQDRGQEATWCRSPGATGHRRRRRRRRRRRAVCAAACGGGAQGGQAEEGGGARSARGGGALRRQDGCRFRVQPAGLSLMPASVATWRSMGYCAEQA